MGFIYGIRILRQIHCIRLISSWVIFEHYSFIQILKVYVFNRRNNSSLDWYLFVHETTPN